MNRLYYLLIILFAISSVNCNKNHDIGCNCNPIRFTADKYSYPVKPGSAEWNAAGAAGGLDSIYKLCQIPSNVLPTMSTLGLIQSLEYNPCLGNIFLRTNLFQGRNEVLPRLNVSVELNKRNDAALNMMAYYKEIDPCCVLSLKTDLEKGEFTSYMVLLDIVYTQDSLLNQLSLSEKKQFADIIINKYNIQLKYPDIFGFSKTTSMLVLSQLMINASFQPYIAALQSDSELSYFASTTELVSNEVLNKVLSYAKLFTEN